MTIAMDVRGFGTYADATGFESISMKDCVEDLKSLMSHMRHEYPNMPIFMLGESMGGALALRAVAEAQDNVDGLICSVPSGSRHDSLSTALSVGANYLKDKHKPIPIGQTVIAHATSDIAARNAWLNDPASRLNLSAAELLDFQLFMNDNAACARKITRTPVIIFQGHNDKLVKEKGTFDLFDALKTPQKSMVILGNTEHLIFETRQFKEGITLGIISWMESIAESLPKAAKKDI
jgi:alpha-beta hydrolase superfamily lysophospholipase